MDSRLLVGFPFPFQLPAVVDVVSSGLLFVALLSLLPAWVCRNFFVTMGGWLCSSGHNCNNHMGWRFDAERPDMKPIQFWGLTRRSLISSLPDDPAVLSFPDTTAVH